MLLFADAWRQRGTAVCMGSVFWHSARTHTAAAYTATRKLIIAAAVGWLVVAVAGIDWGMDHCVLQPRFSTFDAAVCYSGTAVCCLAIPGLAIYCNGLLGRTANGLCSFIIYFSVVV